MFKLQYYHGTKSVSMFTYDAIKAQWVVMNQGIVSNVKIIEGADRIKVVQLKPFNRLVQSFPTAATAVFYDHQDSYKPAKKAVKKSRVKTSK